MTSGEFVNIRTKSAAMPETVHSMGIWIATDLYLEGPLALQPLGK